MENKKILVIGAGGIGGIVASILKSKGFDVEIICKYPAYAEKIKNEGLKVTGILGTFKVKMPAYASASEINKKYDIVLHSTKAYDVIESTKNILHVFTENTYVVSLQNGICEEAIASVIGKDKVIGCIVGWGATMLKPGELEMTSKGEFVIGNIENKEDNRLNEIKEIFENILPVRISTNILGYLYSKLVINSCITSLGAIGGIRVGKMLKRHKVRKIFICIINEAVNVANKMNLVIEPYSGKFDYYKFVRGNGFLSNIRRHLLIMFIGFKYRRLKSSSLQSLERGGKTEVDYLNGYISSKGKELNIPTPVNDLIIKTIKEIEEGKRIIGTGNYRLFFTI